MKRTIFALTTVIALTGTAFAEFSIRNDDDSSYELTKKCGDMSEDWSIAGKVTKKMSIPAGATSCTFTVKKTSSSCTVKDNDTCVIDRSGKMTKQ